MSKLRFSRVAPPFSTAAELRDALLQSYPEAAYFGDRPVVAIHRGDETEPAWLWVQKLIRQRTDWWPALGIALQHAVHDGGEIARTALGDLLFAASESMVLLQWTGPLANAGSERLAEVIARQRVLHDEQLTAPVALSGIEPDGRWTNVEVQTQAQLDALLAATACVGQRTGFGVDPTGGLWSWLVYELLVHEPLRPMIVTACDTFSGGSDAEVRAVLDWFTDEHDLWRYVDLLERWERSHPPWWDAPAKTKAAGWKYPVRDWLADRAKTLGDIALAALARAKQQAATPPVIDLAPLATS